MKFTMMMLLTTSMIYLMKKTPISMLIMLIIYCILMTNNLFIHYSNKWMIYIIILMIVGGMLIMFLYTTSMIPNISNPKILKSPIMLTLIYLLSMIMLWKYSNISMNFSNMNNYNHLPMMIMNFSPMYYFTMLSIIYLLITLFITLKIIKTTTKSMRQF
uniref:NADH dehydrogenase subunit 6 n=1 Tax=Ceraphron sp. MM-2014 TaxID=1502696 RepID=A0A096XL13_9HYME|nr:NADH dehydrogenase subunit 6 [Ceraphron sp. MM-2014]